MLVGVCHQVNGEAIWDYPIDVEYAVSSLDDWPRLYLEVGFA
jgi:hypothetical protein